MSASLANSFSPLPSKPWSSGRVLTKLQREQKRTKDRITKQKRKNETNGNFKELKEKIAILISHIEGLKAQNNVGYQPSERSLTPISSHLFRGGTENESHLFSNQADDMPTMSSQALSQISLDSLSPIPMCESSLTKDFLPIFEEQWSGINVTDEAVSDLVTFESIEEGTSNFNDIVILSDNNVDHVQPYLQILHPPGMDSGSTPSTPRHPYLPLNKRSSSNRVQKLFSEMVQRARLLNPNTICVDESLNQHALISGVTQSWDTLTGLPSQCPLWGIIRELDDRLFCQSGEITRFCTLRMTHYILMYLAGALQITAVPSWLRPRPSQQQFEHALAVDVLPWPGVRERAVLSHQLTRTDNFWNDVIYLFRFQWPYDVGEAVSMNARTGVWRFSGLFEKYVRDIRFWQMDHSFFTAFPETFDDIAPAMDVIPNFNIAASHLSMQYCTNNDRNPDDIDSCAGTVFLGNGVHEGVSSYF